MRCFFAPRHSAGAVAALRTFWSGTVNLHKLRLVDIATERAFDGFQIRFVPVARKLHAVLKALREVVHKEHRGLAVAIADVPRANKFALRVEGKASRFPGHATMRAMVHAIFRNGRRGIVACYGDEWSARATSVIQHGNIVMARVRNSWNDEAILGI